MKTLHLLSLGTVALAGLVGCSRQEQAKTESTLRHGGQATVKTLKKGGSTAVKSLDHAAELSADAALTGAVKTRFLADKWLGATGIDVTTKNNVVTLTGTVPAQKQKARASKIALDTAGVRSVINRLQIKK